MSKWYSTITNKGSDHEQGLIIETETGNAVAVSYKSENAKLISLAPELLESIRIVYSRVANTNIHTPIGDMSDTWDILRKALALDL